MGAGTSFSKACHYSSRVKSYQKLADLQAHVGAVLGTSEWILVDQARIDQFASVTGDNQWIHVDPEKAAAGPFGSPIAHGFLTLSLIPKFFDSSIQITGSRMGVNYGLNRVRFTAPVPVGSQLRGRMKLLAAEPVEKDGMQLTWQITVEVEGSDKPVCVAESLVRRYP